MRNQIIILLWLDSDEAETAKPVRPAILWELWVCWL